VASQKTLRGLRGGLAAKTARTKHRGGLAENSRELSSGGFCRALVEKTQTLYSNHKIVFLQVELFKYTCQDCSSFSHTFLKNRDIFLQKATKNINLFEFASACCFSEFGRANKLILTQNEASILFNDFECIRTRNRNAKYQLNFQYDVQCHRFPFQIQAISPSASVTLLAGKNSALRVMPLLVGRISCSTSHLQILLLTYSYSKNKLNIVRHYLKLF
jgi:hypothetical protein